MPRISTARLVADCNQRVAEAEERSSKAAQVVQEITQRHKIELAAAEKEAAQKQHAICETRREAFEELLRHHGKQQCSLCFEAAPATKIKLICAVYAQGNAGTAEAKLPNWSRASLMRICPACAKDRKQGSLSFLDNPGSSTNAFHEMWRLWFPARQRGDVWELLVENRWRPVPQAAIDSGYFTDKLQTKLVLTVAQRLGWNLVTSIQVYEQWKTVREQYADELAKQRQKREEHERSQHYCDRCGVYHNRRCPRAPRTPRLYGARAA